ncbi:MAG: hypothetical protein ABIN94_08645 [Ferruginibacter sp.]
MKNDKSSQNKKVSDTAAKKPKANKTKSVGVDQSTSATGKTKSRVGHGLQNEGTVVSYDEQR